MSTAPAQASATDLVFVAGIGYSGTGIQPGVTPFYAYFEKLWNTRQGETMFRHIVTLALLLCLAAPALAAEKAADDGAAPTARATDKAAAPAEDAAPRGPEQLSCKYYTVILPDDWKAIMAPTEKQGMTSAIFARTAGSAVVTMVVGPCGVAEGKTIAGMFAEQFKAEKPPVEKNGQYTFSFTQQGMPCQAWVGTEGDVFMVTTLTGNRKEAQAFIRQYIKSADYPKLLPQL